MEQLTQQLKSGDMKVQEVALPALRTGAVLVRNHFSLISAGTEGSTVKTARKGLIGKAKERPEQVRQVISVLKTQGPVQTYRAVMKKLDAYSPLGYSSAGVVLDVAPNVAGFAVGDRVACAGGGYANHAEVVSIPTNLCVKLPKDANLKSACYNTLGAIALQGIRQADLRLGESCVVIGLGLLGQLTCLMLRASGVRTYGIDVAAAAVHTAKANCCDMAWQRDEPGLQQQIEHLTEGLGVDSVIITAASSSLDPINFSGKLVRKKGRVVVVGAVPTGFDRDDFYKKELDLRMSCSYGPGRYDLDYEEKGIDYPAAYVRWTENRNMRAFQHLIQNNQIQLDYLTTHEFDLSDISDAYNMVVSRSEPFLGIVVRYDTEKPLPRERISIRNSKPLTKVGVAFLGAGSYAQGNLLPNLPQNDAEISYRCVMTNSGTTSKRVAEKFGFEKCTSQIEDILTDDSINTVFVATQHDSHGTFVQQCLEADKHVYVEKPVCLTEIELASIESIYEHSSRQLMVGFNRRFAPLAVDLKSKLSNAPMSMIYRINAGAIPASSWIQDSEMGGGRVIGEACHFIDFLSFLCGANVQTVHANALPDPYGLNDTVCINLKFANGSIGTVCYFANGNKSLPKEHVEVFQAGQCLILRDFKQLEVHVGGKSAKSKSFSQDKGQARMLKEFLQSLKMGGENLIPFEDLVNTARTTFAVQQSLREEIAKNV